MREDSLVLGGWSSVFLSVLALAFFSGFARPANTAEPSDGFNYPIGPRVLGFVTEADDGDGWRNDQDFKVINTKIRTGFALLHAGEDWNDEDGGSSDVGAPVYAVSHGEVMEIRDLGAVGEFLVLEHTLDDNSKIYSVYLHIKVDCGLHVGDEVARDQKIGEIVDISSSGFSPHLHFELRTKAVTLGDLYDNDFLNSGYYLMEADMEVDGLTIDPSDFIDTRRPSPDTPSPVDVYLVVDLSGSFSNDLVNFKIQVPGIVSTLQTSNPNTRFGLGKFEDYPISPFGRASRGDQAYEQLVDLTFDADLISDTVAALFVRSGGDGPESQLAALFQAATGAGQDLAGVGFPGASISPCQQATFRDGNVTKIFLLWTDAPFHHPGDAGSIPYPGPSFDATVDAILALDPPKVIGISSGGAGITDLEDIVAATDAFAPSGGVDCDGDGTIDILEGEPLVCTIAASGEGIGEAIIAIIEAATTIMVKLDIKPGGDPNPVTLQSMGVIPVAILTTDTFDATTVDPLSVEFGPSGASEAHGRGHIKDADSDGDLDLVLHFATQDTGIVCGNTFASLTGETFDGQAIEGTDAINTVRCE